MHSKIVMLCIVSVAIIQADESISRFDSIDYEEILASERLLNNYVNCLLDRGPCTPEGNELKKFLPDALATNCGNCSPSRQEKYDKILTFLAKNKKVSWHELTVKYDPTGEYRLQYKESRGVDLDSL
ncbi:ejaculatory bulb-specific protein 3-like [Sitophilus oryzae]|uniref:Ejaculatory bulb-specific protein 3-like n=1 Tax=Sitophilus oryzae TaxID=7048 RepID=A0A6J2Y629_SITOR|nr:ejaculatory bulb-specific protein 3-like [Sitophilus oryzae]